MKDQHSASDKAKEPPRPRTVPDDFIWDPELQAWYAPGEPGDFDVEAWRRNFQKLCEELRDAPPDSRGGAPGSRRDAGRAARMEEIAR